MKAIETSYNGYRFRSRLEARWAVFFDAIGARWEYEPEGFDLGGDLGPYLPDFFVHMSEDWDRKRITPAAGYWIEIKPIDPTELEQRKIASLALQSGHHAYLMVGLPGQHWHWFSSFREERNQCQRTTSWPGSTPAMMLSFLVHLWSKEGCYFEDEKYEYALRCARAARFGRGLRG